jgi:hypothetical protein
MAMVTLVSYFTKIGWSETLTLFRGTQAEKVGNPGKKIVKTV